MWTTKNRARYERKCLRYDSDLTDEEYALIEDFLPPERNVSRCSLVNGILYVLTTGCQWCQWRQLPKYSPPKSTTHDYFVELQCTSVLKRFQAAPTLAEWRLVGTGEAQSAERQPSPAAPQPRLDSVPRVAPLPGHVQAPSDPIGPPIGGVRCPPGTALQRGRCAPVGPGGGRRCGPGRQVRARPPADLRMSARTAEDQRHVRDDDRLRVSGRHASTGADGLCVCVTPGGIVTPATVICAKGQVVDGRGVCVADPVLECPVNTSRMGTKCIPTGGGKPIDATTRCQGGMVLNSGGICEAPVPELANPRRQQAFAPGRPGQGFLGRQPDAQLRAGRRPGPVGQVRARPPVGRPDRSAEDWRRSNQADETAAGSVEARQDQARPGSARPNAQEKVKKITTGCTPLRKKLRRC